MCEFLIKQRCGAQLYLDTNEASNVFELYLSEDECDTKL